MDAIKAQAIVCNLAALCIATLVLGLVISWWIRRGATTGGLSMPGKVQAKPYDLLDLGVAGVLISYLTLPLIAATAQKATRTEAVPGSINTAIAIALLSLLLGICVFLFASLLRGRNPVSLFGLSRLYPHKILLWAAAAFLVAYPLMIGAVSLQEYFMGKGEQLQEVVRTLIGTDNPALKAVLASTAIIVAPLVEEIIFRGYFYAVIKRYSGCCFAAIMTSLLFAIVHGNLPGIVPLFTLSLILTLVYEITGCLWVPIAAHSLFNAIQVSLMLNIQNG
jgi:membrane protease YdiL (CAAX protease family)